MLYLPPRVPHCGVSLDDDCMTVSMGFRAPAYRSVVTALCDHVCQTVIAEKQLYLDPQADLGHSQRSPGYISETARRSVQATVREQLLRVLDDNDKFDAWIGSYLTIPLRMVVRDNSTYIRRS